MSGELDFVLLHRFALSERQHQLIEAVQEHGNPSAAAKAIGIDDARARRNWREIKRRAAEAGYDPDADATHGVPEGQQLRGLSTLYDKSGNVAMQWVKTMVDPRKQAEFMRQVIEAFTEELPRAERHDSHPRIANKDLLTQYTFADAHIGMLAWGKETGEDWDLVIAKKTILAWMRKAVGMAPPSKEALLLFLGDLLHWDGMEAVTPTSRNVLDADTRFQRLVTTVVWLARIAVKTILEKHQHVRIIVAEGNHDMASTVWLTECLKAYYEDEPRVTIDTSPDIYYCYEFGRCSIFAHHGHQRKPENVDDVFVAKFREVFGRTDFSYGHMGHMHFKKVLETALMDIIQHPTLAARDAYASRGGYMSKRAAKVHIYHRKYGLVCDYNISPEMAEAE